MEAGEGQPKAAEKRLGWKDYTRAFALLVALMWLFGVFDVFEELLSPKTTLPPARSFRMVFTTDFNVTQIEGLISVSLANFGRENVTVTNVTIRNLQSKTPCNVKTPFPQLIQPKGSIAIRVDECVPLNATAGDTFESHVRIRAKTTWNSLATYTGLTLKENELKQAKRQVAFTSEGDITTEFDKVQRAKDKLPDGP